MFFIQRFGVYHWKNFEFEDNTKKDKYFITLNCNLNDKEIALVLPTSQVEKYNNFPNRLIDTIIISSNESRFFKKDTLIDLKNIKYFEAMAIYDAVERGKINYLGLLEEKLTKKIEKAIKEAITLSPKLKKQFLCNF
jgi:hypothetical protein